MDDDAQKRGEESPPVPPGFVRPLTDPEQVARWFGMHERPTVLVEYDPFSKYWMNT